MSLPLGYADLALGTTLTLDGAPHAFDIGVTLSNVSLRLATRSSIDASALGDLTIAGLLHAGNATGAAHYDACEAHAPKLLAAAPEPRAAGDPYGMYGRYGKV